MELRTNNYWFLYGLAFVLFFSGISASFMATELSDLYGWYFNPILFKVIDFGVLLGAFVPLGVIYEGYQQWRK